ncbi:hypothetical protein JCM5353_006375 [Sporobolomyces roseus]
MTLPDNNLVVPKGSLVLVTGANGFLGSHVVEQFLENGFKVRGTVRSLDKLSNLEQRWESKYPGMFEAVEIADLTKEGCYHEAMKDVVAFAHTAADVTFVPDYDLVINGLVKSTLNALRAAAATPSIKRVVLTSSYISAAMPQTGQDGSKFDENSWNDQIVEMAKSTPEGHPARGFFIYMASKVLGEKAAWDFVIKEKPSFAFNAVLPGFCIGELFDSEKQAGSTSGITRDIFLMKTNEIAKMTPVQAMCSATDIALLHVGACVLPRVENKRLFGTSHIATWNDILSHFRRLYPNQQAYEDFDERRKEISHYDEGSSLEVLKKFGQDGWKSLEDAIRDNIDPIAG